MLNQTFRALNDATRRRILQLLRDGDLTAGEIADQFALTKPTVSHHLDLLKQAQLVEARRVGQFIHYSLNATVVDEIISWFIQLREDKDRQSNTSTNDEYV